MNKNKYILTIDQGTTSTRTIIFDYRGTIVTKSQMEFSQICPKNGWVEHNPEEIWELTLQTIKNAINSINLKVTDIAAIGITNQRETTVPVSYTHLCQSKVGFDVQLLQLHLD